MNKNHNIAAPSILLLKWIFCFSALVSIANANDEVDTDERVVIYKFLGRDYSKLSPNEQLSHWIMNNPVEAEHARQRRLTTEEKNAEKLSLLAVTDPKKYRERFPKSGEQSEELKAAIAGMLNPLEAKAIRDAKKSEKDKELEKLYVWAILHPTEFNELRKTYVADPEIQRDWKEKEKALLNPIQRIPSILERTEHFQKSGNK